jgi:CDP-glucose 4,6-dehydratase
MVTTRDFWRGRRVLVTGHTGFKGAWLALWLESLGAEVTGLSLAPPGEPNLFTLARVAGGVRSIECDIRDFDAVSRVVAETHPDFLFHLAAQSLVRYSYAEPMETFATNVLGTVHLLEAMRRLGGRAAAVIVTSDKCYENRGSHAGYRESDPLGGKDPYSASKACAEIVTASYRHSFFAHGPLAVATARAGNVIGGGDWAADRLVPDMVRALQRREEIVLRNPQAVRPWQHVLEPLAGYLLLARRLWEAPASFAGAWNFGPAADDALPVQELVARFLSRWGSGTWRVSPDPARPEAETLRLDASRAVHHLGWQRQLDINGALDWTADWYRAWVGGADPRVTTLAQIAEYQKRVNA